MRFAEIRCRRGWLYLRPSPRKSCPPKRGCFPHRSFERADNRTRARSWFASQFFYLLDEVGCFLKSPIDAGEAHVGDFVNLAQPFHHQLADNFARDLTLMLV